jgi:peptide/nickel transport system permease protein
LVFAIVTIFIIMTLNFIIFRLMPGDPVSMIADVIRLRPEQVRRLYELFGLDKPLWQQYVQYLSQTVQGFYGYSFYTQRPVSQDIMERLPNTLLLLGTSTVLSIVIGMVVGIVAAARRGSLVDISAISFGFLGNSVPIFWLGLILLLVFGVNLKWFPLRGTTSVPAPTEPLALVTDILWHMTLPTLALVIILFGGYALVMRAAMIDVLTEDYITLARAKGNRRAHGTLQTRSQKCYAPHGYGNSSSLRFPPVGSTAYRDGLLVVRPRKIHLGRDTKAGLSIPPRNILRHLSYGGRGEPHSRPDLRSPRSEGEV